MKAYKKRWKDIIQTSFHRLIAILIWRQKQNSTFFSGTFLQSRNFRKTACWEVLSSPLPISLMSTILVGRSLAVIMIKCKISKVCACKVKLAANLYSAQRRVVMRSYSIVDYFGYNLSPQERMNIIKEAGFSGVILLWTNQFDSDYRDFPKYAEKAGLYVENTHAPYLQANSLWIDSLNGQEYADVLIGCIKDCAVYSIPTLVMHPTNGKTPLPTSDIGIERLKRIVGEAEKLNINLAIENIETPKYLEYIFSKIQSEKLGFCFDSGHHNFYSPELNLLDLYGDKLMALHLHDNNGKEDMHALPYSGSIDWKKISSKLIALDYRGAIALETLNKGFEKIKSPLEFLKVAIDRARQIL